MTIILSNLNRLKNFTGRFLCKFAVKWVLKIPPHLAYVATLPCKTLKVKFSHTLACNFVPNIHRFQILFHLYTQQ